MNEQLAKDIIAVLPQDRTLFRYHPDRYAFQLLSYAFDDPLDIARIKKSPYGKLLDRPAVRDLIARKGSGKLEYNDFLIEWPLETLSYVLTLGIWGSRLSSERHYHQTSRTGFNLVLQLNFDKSHDKGYEQHLAPLRTGDFSFDGHPISTKDRTTLAWSRLDLDFDTGEALIEEVQSDWVRNALYEIEATSDAYPADHKFRKGIEAYERDHLRPHIKVWPEAILAATLFFLIEEMGLRKIWMHEYESGNRLKNLTWMKPPKSLYTSLPKKFCFHKVNFPPQFLVGNVSRKQKKRFAEGREKFWHFST